MKVLPGFEPGRSVIMHHATVQQLLKFTICLLVCLSVCLCVTFVFLVALPQLTRDQQEVIEVQTDGESS